MKRGIIASAGFVFLMMFCAGLSIAQEKATREECIAKCKEAAALIREVGVEAALAKIQDAKGPFVWKDSYVLAQDLDGKMLAHPVVPGLVGKVLRGTKDSSGKMFGSEMLEIANNAGEGWMEYMWPKPGEKEPSRKIAYIYRVPGETLFVSAGIYEN